MNGENDVTWGTWVLRWLRIVGNELQNFGAGWGYPLPCFFINVDSGGVEMEWNQHLWKC